MVLIIEVLVYRNASLIYNPSAGNLRGRRAWRIRSVVEVLNADGHTVHPTPTGGPGTAGEIARRSVEAGADLIISLGGDGTLNEILPGVIHSGVPVTMIPAGTANVLARELGMGTNPVEVARALGGLEPRNVSAGLLRTGDGHERPFLLMAGAGFDAQIVYRLNVGLKAKLGELAYWASASRELFRRLPQFEVSACGGTYRCSFALVSRVRNYAGYMQIAQEISLADDAFEVVLFEGTSPLRHYARYMAAVLARRASNTKGLTFLRTDRLTISAPADARAYLQVDGEYAGRLPVSLEIVPKAVRLLMPPDYPDRR
jgi:diacylglycerol kinase (ATP)